MAAGADEKTVSARTRSRTSLAEGGELADFGIVEDGEVVSSAQLFIGRRHGAGRGRRHAPRVIGAAGHASAFVTRAVEEAARGSHEFIFLVAEGDDWPKKLYAASASTEVGSRFAYPKRG